MWLLSVATEYANFGLIQVIMMVLRPVQLNHWSIVARLIVSGVAWVMVTAMKLAISMRLN